MAMDPIETAQDFWTWQTILLLVVLILIILAVVNDAVARWAERRHPPKGAFMDVDGVRLHYRDWGSGPAVVLVHGNIVTGDDYNTSGVAQRLTGLCRVIIFDRPGFGYSERPRWRPWTAQEQAELLHKALMQLEVQRPVVVGHSWGTLVALAMAIRYPANTAGLVLLSGYYFPTLRLDSLLVAVAAIPILGDVLRYTIAPVFGWLTMPLTKRMMFAPAPVTAQFRAEYSDAMALRPSQIRATCVDGTTMVPSVMRLRHHYAALSMPVAIMAGAGDKVVSRRLAERLRAVIPGSSLQIIGGAGHMIHHVATERVVRAILALARPGRVPASS
jgi:pimeloyl-ACP methyl ester carboxylesterase